MKIRWKLLIACVLIPIAVGALSGFLTKDGMKQFETVQKPMLAPPNWVFPVVWTILFILMGVASYLVLVSNAPKKLINTSMTFYIIQLIFNFFWSIIFFNGDMYLFAFIWLVTLWILILITTVFFHRASKAASILMIPYLAWVGFAGYLNFAIYILNR